MMSPSVTPATVIELIYTHGGNVSAVAKALHVTRQTMYAYIERHAKVKDAWIDAREVALDEAEDILQQRIRAGEAWAIALKLKTQGKDRGYTERQEVVDVSGGPLEITTKVVYKRDAKTNP